MAVNLIWPSERLEGLVLGFANARRSTATILELVHVDAKMIQKHEKMTVASSLGRWNTSSSWIRCQPQLIDVGSQVFACATYIN